LDSSGLLIASTLLGGSADDEGTAIAADAAGSAYVTGLTRSLNFPTAAALQPTYAGGEDAFVTKLNAELAAVEYSTYLGGSRADRGSGIAIDATGTASIVGVTSSTDFPTANAFQASLKGASDAFVARLNGAGSAFVFSTYFGGSLLSFQSGSDEAAAVAIDSAGTLSLRIHGFRRPADGEGVSVSNRGSRQSGERQLRRRRLRREIRCLRLAAPIVALGSSLDSIRALRSAQGDNLHRG
jgi:hypothetical protein